MIAAFMWSCTLACVDQSLLCNRERSSRSSNGSDWSTPGRECSTFPRYTSARQY